MSVFIKETRRGRRKMEKEEEGRGRNRRDADNDQEFTTTINQFQATTPLAADSV